MDITEVVTMARECGCYKVGFNGELIICRECSKVAAWFDSKIEKLREE